jgi:hypothetical protein
MTYENIYDFQKTFFHICFRISLFVLQKAKLVKNQLALDKMKLQRGITLCLLLLTRGIFAVDVEIEQFSSTEKKVVEDAADSMPVAKPLSSFSLRSGKEARRKDSMTKADYKTFDAGEKVGEYFLLVNLIFCQSFWCLQ